MLGHPLHEIREQQRTLATTCAAQLAGDLHGRVGERLGEIRDLLRSSSMESAANFDPDALSTALKVELEVDALSAIHGYTDWVATKLVREKKTSGHQELPMPNPGELSLIGDRYGASRELLKAVVHWLRRQDRIPLLGEVSGGKLQPDTKALATWRDLFDWDRA